MKIEVLYFKGCPNHSSVVEQVRQAVGAEGVEATLEEIEITDSAMAQETAFLGSPSVRVDGLDIEPDARGQHGFGFGCRTYSDVEGRRTGLPPIGLIRQALMEASTPTSKSA